MNAYQIYYAGKRRTCKRPKPRVEWLTVDEHYVQFTFCLNCSKGIAETESIHILEAHLKEMGKEDEGSTNSDGDS
jgi:hypothetical protein